MPKVVVTHAVKDIENWLKYHAERVSQLAPFATNVTDHVAMDGSKNVAVSMDVQDPAAMGAVLASPPAELQAAMDRHGVIAPLTAHIEK